MGMRTIMLKLHNPSKSKQLLLERAMAGYQAAYTFLMKEAYSHLDEMNSIHPIALTRWMDKNINDQLNQLQVQPLKDALKADVGMTLAGYFRLKAKKPATAFPLHGNRDSQESGVRPIYFCRYDTKRSYCLLHDPKKDRYYAKLYLMNNANAKRSVEVPKGQSKLHYIHKSGYRPVESTKKETYIIVPLSFGKYQEEFLKQALETPEILRTAKLCKHENTYFLAVGIHIEDPSPINTTSYLGISINMKDGFSFAVLDKKQQIQQSGNLTASLADNLHTTANQIAALAEKYNSQVIVPSAIPRRSVAAGSSHCSTHRLAQLLKYKLPAIGLPQPIRVSASNIYSKCTVCGCCTSKNRLTSDVFICTSCGNAMDTASLSSINLAGRLIEYGKSPLKVKVKNTREGIWFSNRLLKLDLMIPYGQDPIPILQEQIKQILQEIKSQAESNTQADTRRSNSILKKFNQSDTLMDFIEFI